MAEDSKLIREIVVGLVALTLGGGAGSLSASAQVKAEMREMDDRIDRVESNQKLIDYQVREAQQEAEHNGLKLDRLLTKEGIEKPPKPSLPESEIDQ